MFKKIIGFLKFFFTSTEEARVIVSDGRNCFVVLRNHSIGCLAADNETFPCELKLSVVFYGYRIVPSYFCRPQGRYQLELIYRDQDRWLVKTVENEIVTYGFVYDLPEGEWEIGQKVLADRGDNVCLTMWEPIQ